ncbi:MAG: hypothetical protein AAFO84_15935 [Cyanobacteria bacterium J06598_1]
MTSTQIKEFKSKGACPRCNEHKLFTNETHKDAPVVHYHCLRCNHEFSETAEFKEYREKQKKKEAKKENSLGAAFLALLVVVILAVLVSRESEVPNGELQPTGQVEQLQRWAG